MVCMPCTLYISVLLHLTMKALKCKPSAQFKYNYRANVLSKCSNIISQQYLKVDTLIIDLRRSTHRSPMVDTLIFESRHIDLRRWTHRSSKVDTSIFEGSTTHRAASPLCANESHAVFHRPVCAQRKRSYRLQTSIEAYFMGEKH